MTKDHRIRRRQCGCEVPIQREARHFGSVSCLLWTTSVVMRAPCGIDRSSVLNRQSGRNQRVGLGDAGVEQTHGRSVASWRRQPCSGIIYPQSLFCGCQINKESACGLRFAKFGEFLEDIQRRGQLLRCRQNKTNRPIAER